MMKKKWITVCAFVAACALCAPVLAFQDGSAEMTASLFLSDGVAFTSRAKVPSEAYEGDSRYGLKMTADNDGESATLSSSVIGKFEMDFAVYSQADFVGDAASPTYSNDYADVQELSFAFTDVHDEENSFEVAFAPGYAGNCVTPMAYVRAKGETAGIVSVGNALNEQTAVKNADGIYTAVEGASFSNKAFKNSALSDDVKSLVLTFDPDTMSVYVKAKGGMRYLVWNFSNRINDAKDVGFTLDKMKEYTVSVQFTDLAEGREGNLIVYSVNGRDTSWHYLGNDERVGISADVALNGVVGQPYEIQTPTFTENVKSATVNVVGPVSNETYDLEDGLTFTPNFAGNYTLIYNAVSDKGVHSSAEYVVEVFAEAPQTAFAFSSVLYEENYGVGSSVVLPETRVSGGLLKGETGALLTVYRDGTVLDGYENKADYDLSFTFEEAGEYGFVFSSIDGSKSKEYQFTVDGTLPTFACLEFQDEFAFGETARLPDWQIVENGKACEYTVTTVKPSGETVDGREFFADELGVYETRYVVSYGEGKTAEYVRSFSVRKRTVGMFSSTTSAIDAGIETAWFNNKLTGLLLSASSSFTAVYENEIDLSDNTKEDLLLEFAVVPEIVGTENYSQLVITFTDVEDEENYFAVELTSGSQSGDPISRTYVKAGAPNQIRSGWHRDGANLHVGGKYGTFTIFSFSGSYTASETGNKTMRLYYDNEEKRVYLCYEGSSKAAVVDFDDPECFSTLWGGLTNGKVRMSIQTQGYVSGKANVLLKSVDGFDLTREFVVEEEKPFIAVDLLGYGEGNLPNAVVGKEYDLFTAKAYAKLQGNLNCETEVYYAYGSENEEKVDISKGFVPKRSGRYTIVYSTMDNYGVANRKTIELFAMAASDYQDLSSNVSNADDKSLYVGEKDAVKEILAKGGVGRLDVQIALTGADGSVVELNRKGEFVLEKAGVYTVTYKVTDYLHTEKTFSYQIDCAVSEKPIVNEEAYLPNGLARDFEYTLPTIEGYDYSVNGEKRKASVSISVWSADGETLLETLGADRTFTPIAEYGDCVLVKYLIGGANGYVVKTYTLEIGDLLDMEMYSVDKTKLFASKNVSQTVADENCVAFEVKEGADVGFINGLLVNNVSFRIGAKVDEQNKIGRMTVYLTDAMDENIRVGVEILFENDKAYTYNDKGEKISVLGISLTDFSVYKFVYRYGDHGLCDQIGTLLCTFKTTVYGDPFEGFASGKVNVNFVAEDVVGKPQFLVNEIGAYAINNDLDDNAPPRIYFNQEIKGFGLVGDKVFIPAAISADVVSPVSTVLLTVTLNEEPVADENGVELTDVDGMKAHSFVASKPGIYRITYYYYDAFDNSNEYNKAVSVVEKNAPTITVKGGVKAKAKVGDKLVVPDFTVSDDTTAPEKIKKQVYVITHTGTFVEVDGTYKFKEAGKYVLRYVAYDQFYNYTITDYVIEVVK